MAKRIVTDEMRARWRAAAFRNRPWLGSTGPKSAEGKAQAVRNGKARQRGEHSYRELLEIVRALREELRAAINVRKKAAEQLRARRLESKGQR